MVDNIQISAFSNRTIQEFNIPRDATSTVRLLGFFGQGLGWEDAREDSEEAGFWYIGPYRDQPPTVTYWQTENTDKIGLFVRNDSPEPSKWSRGLHLPPAALGLVALCEQTLLVPNDDHTQVLWDQGGDLLQAHATQPLCPHSGVLEFRFRDPFGFQLRVTSDPGYEMPGQTK